MPGNAEQCPAERRSHRCAHSGSGRRQTNTEPPGARHCCSEPHCRALAKKPWSLCRMDGDTNRSQWGKDLAGLFIAKPSLFGPSVAETRRTFRFKSASPVLQILSSGNVLQDHVCYHFPLGEILSGVQLMDDSHLIMPLPPHKGLV